MGDGGGGVIKNGKLGVTVENIEHLFFSYPENSLIIWARKFSKTG
jgi:hypothetical protein